MVQDTPLMEKTTICPDCGGGKNARSRRCQHCHLVAIAPLGWNATKAKYGDKVSVKHTQKYRLKHPSSLEKKVMRQLSYHGVLYERECWYDAPDGSVFLIDFVIHTGGVLYAIEVNGDWSHSYHAIRDAKKVAFLTGSGYTVIVLDEKTVNDPVALIHALVDGMNLNRMAVPAPDDYKI